MQLFVLRHGDAERLAASDYERQLTERGKQEVEAVVKRHEQELSVVEKIFVSPLTRAQQTAAIVSGYFPNIPTETTDILVPSHNTTEALAFLCQQNSDGTILLVSHQPLVSELVSDLCDLATMAVGMHTAALASIVLDPVARGMGKLNYID